MIDWLLTITATVSPQVVYLKISVVDAASVKLILCLWHTKWLHAVLLEINTMIMIIKNLKTLLREHRSSNTRTKNNIINNKANKTTANGDILVKLLWKHTGWTDMYQLSFLCSWVSWRKMNAFVNKWKFQVRLPL